MPNKKSPQRNNQPSISDADFKTYVLSSLEKILDFQATTEKRLQALEEFKNKSEKKITDVEDGLCYQQTEIEELRKCYNEQKEVTEKLSSALEHITVENKDLANQANKLERFSRRNNLRFYGCNERPGENSGDVQRDMERYLAEKFNLPPRSVQRAHRVGKVDPQKKSERPIIVKFTNWQDKMKVLTSWRRALGDQGGQRGRDSGVRVSDDLTEADLRLKKSLHPVMEKAFKEGKRVRFTDGRLYINGKIHGASGANDMD